MNPAAVTCASESGSPATAAAPSTPSSRQKYSADTMAMAPKAAGRITSSSAHPKRKAGSRPNPSRMYTYMPPVRGYIAASSA